MSGQMQRSHATGIGHFNSTDFPRLQRQLAKCSTQHYEIVVSTDRDHVMN